jgi:hypothetical protein
VRFCLCTRTTVCLAKIESAVQLVRCSGTRSPPVCGGGGGGGGGVVRLCYGRVLRVVLSRRGGFLFEGRTAMSLLGQVRFEACCYPAVVVCLLAACLL